MGCCRNGAGAETERSHVLLCTGSRKDKLEIGVDSQSPSPGNTLPPARLCLLNSPKEHHHLGTASSDSRTDGSISHLNYHSVS